MKIPKNVTIYLPDEVATRMEKYPEVNWSEICRKAVIDYVDTRSHMDIGPILEKLRAERNEDYKQGQILFYQIAPKISLKEYEIWYNAVSEKINKGKHENRDEHTTPLPPEYLKFISVTEMGFFMGRFCDRNNITYPSNPTDAFWEGAIEAFMRVYKEIDNKDRRFNRERSAN